MHSPRGVEKILPVAKSDLFLLFHSPLVSCSESLRRRRRNYLSFTFPASVTSLLYSHWFDSIQILNSQVHALFLPPPFVCFFFFFIDVFNSDLWHYLGELSDLSLRRVACRLESSVIASRAPGRTTEAYRTAHLRWKEFASSTTEICAFPANSELTESVYWIPTIPTQQLTLPMWKTVGTPFGGFTFPYRHLYYPHS